MKYLNTEVVSLGFPTSCIAAIKNICDVISESPTIIELNVGEQISHDTFLLWKNDIQLTSDASRVLPQINESDHHIPLQNVIISKVRSFPVESKTPMECMNFVCELKKYLANNSLFV
ncbi:MAG: hypothetical protein ACRCZQ_01380 [Bacteroidales bacterium]